MSRTKVTVGAILLALVVTASVAGATAITAAQPAPNDDAIARCEPLNASGPYGQDLTVDIYIQNVVDLYGADVRWSFDTAIAQVVDADGNVPGTQIQPLYTFMVPGFIIKKEADNVAGTVWYAATQLNPSPPVSGSGSLARVTFRANAPGSFPLLVTSAQLSKAGGIPIPVTTMNCSVTFTGAGRQRTRRLRHRLLPIRLPQREPRLTRQRQRQHRRRPARSRRLRHTPRQGRQHQPPQRRPHAQRRRHRRGHRWGRRSACCRGVVFDDLNRDGVRQADEPGIPGVSVRSTALDSANQGQFWETQTIANGSYILFLPPGNYLAQSFSPTSWLPTTPSDVEFTISPAGQPVQIDFGYRQADRIWLPLVRSNS